MTLQIPDGGHYGYSLGFGKVHWKRDGIDYVEWVTCRDEFQNASTRCKSFLYWHGDGNKGRGRVIRFMKRVEDSIKLKATERLKFERTSNKNVMLVILSPFWRTRHCRSLLTAFLRATRYYHNYRQFKPAMWQTIYLDTTRYAVERFLAGHTHLRRRSFAGWQVEFEFEKDKVIDKILVKRKNASRKRT